MFFHLHTSLSVCVAMRTPAIHFMFKTDTESAFARLVLLVSPR